MNRQVKNFMNNYFSSVDTGYPCQIETFCPGLIASSPDTPQVVLELFLISSDTNTLALTAGNPSTPVDALFEMSQHYEPVVKEAVIDNPSTPKEVLFSLAEDPDPDIRYYLAENHNIDPEVLLVLVDDENPYVCARAVDTLSRIKSSAYKQGRVFL